MNLPRATRDLVLSVAHAHWPKDDTALTVSPPPAFVLAVRGYRAASMGKTPDNEVGIFDDAFFLVTPTGMLAENANTDPSKVGWNPGVGKPYFMLDEGLWYFYPGAHKGVRPAFRQADDAATARRLGIPRRGEFTGTRIYGFDNPKNYKETGHQQVNIHPGGEENTSSWACQTVPKSRAKNWLQAATDALAFNDRRLLPYLLVKGP